MSSTPEFLCWAIERRCPLREMLPENDPEKVERQLRAARAVAEARTENRVRGDLAITADGTLGFKVADALAFYGGEAVVAQCCNPCAANVHAGQGAHSYAGCYGLFPLPQTREAFLQRLQRFPRDQRLFSVTQWLWYGWWIRSPLDAEQLLYLAQVFGQLAGEDEFAGNAPLRDLAAALELSAKNGLQMSVQLFPAGEIEGTSWVLRPHCPVCRAPWELGGGVCAVCGQARHPASPKKRSVRGTRPYRPLEELT